MEKVYSLDGEYSVNGERKEKTKPAKRVDIVSVRLVREASMMYKKRTVGRPADGYEIFKEFLEDLDREAFVVLSLNTKNQPLSINTAHIGNINSSIISPACVMRVAILSNAASIMVAHNHPSGDTSPSEADIQVSKRLEEAAGLMGIRLLDHLIIGDEAFLSMKEEGHF